MEKLKFKPNFNILVIDDEAAIREIIEFDLKSRGYHVFTADNGLEGLDIVSKIPVDLIITDLRMPEMGGARLIEEIRRKFKGPIPAIIVMTGHYGMTHEQAFASGACKMISKPFGRNDLINTVQNALTPLIDRWSNDTLCQTEVIKINIEIDDLDRTRSEGKLIFGWGGFFLHTPELVPEEGQQLLFRLEIKKPEFVILEGGGKVVWRRLNKVEAKLAGIGIEISYCKPECLEQMIGLVTDSENLSYIPSSV